MDCNKFSISKLRGKFRKNNLNAEKPAAIYTQGAYMILYTVHICIMYTFTQICTFFTNKPDVHAPSYILALF